MCQRRLQRRPQGYSPGVVAHASPRRRACSCRRCAPLRLRQSSDVSVAVPQVQLHFPHCGAVYGCQTSHVAVQYCEARVLYVRGLVGSFHKTDCLYCREALYGTFDGHLYVRLLRVFFVRYCGIVFASLLMYAGVAVCSRVLLLCATVLAMSCFVPYCIVLCCCHVICLAFIILGLTTVRAAP